MNIVTIQPTTFIDQRSGATTYGFRIYDDYDQSYDNTWDAIPDDDMGVLKLVTKSQEQGVHDALNHCREHERGLFIGDKWYEYGEIKDILNDC